MKITYYASNKFAKVINTEVKEISMQLEPEDMTEEEKELARNGQLTPMLCFDNPDGGFLCIPPEFVIKIED